MTSKKTILVILVATLFQFVTEGAWFLGFAQPFVRAELGCILRASPFIPLNLVSELCLSILIMLVLLRRSDYTSFKKCALAGLIFGLLISLNQQVDLFANWTISPFHH